MVNQGAVDVKKRLIPDAIFCPKCSGTIKLIDVPEHDFRVKIIEQGYDEGARGMCGCGVVVLVCAMRLPKSPTFSMFFDVFRGEAVRRKQRSL